MSWDSFPCSCVYVAFTLIGFVTMKLWASFLRSPLRHVRTAGGKAVWKMLISTKMWLLAVVVAQQAKAHAKCVCVKSHPIFAAVAAECLLEET